MRLIKKIISGLLALTLAFGAVTFIPEQMYGRENTGIVASAAEFYKKVNGFVLSKDEDGDIFVSDYEGKGGNITIPSEATYIGQGAFADNTSVTGVTFPEGTTKYGIQSEAFQACTHLTSITIKGDVGSGNVNGIGSCAFRGCYLLSSVNFTKSNAHVSFIEDGAFMHCFSLSKINIPTGTVRICNDAFTNCLKLYSVTVPEKTEIEGAYAFGYMYGGKTSDDYYTFWYDNGKTKYVEKVKADGMKTVYWELSAKDFDEANYVVNRAFNSEYDYYYLPDDNNEAIAYSFCVPVKQRAITLNVTAGSPAEKWAKERGIRYVSGEGTSSSSQLDAPENLEAVASGSSVTLVWDDVKGASAYRVYIYDSKTSKYKKYKDVSSSKCKVTNLKKGTKYKFKVVALKKNGGSYKEGEYATISVTTDK